MRLNNNEKVITEDDIVLSDGKQTLSERFASQQAEIDQLKSNVKWMYKYGGVGSGGGSGGGGATQQFSIYATINNVQLRDQSIVLNGEGNYPLYVKINNPNGASFNVQYTYTTRSSTGNTITQSQTTILSIENNYTLNTILNLNNNDVLTVVASDGNNTQQVSCTYVTSPYIFSPYLVDNNGNTLSSEIFVSNAQTNGINIRLDYTISVNADIQYSYSFEGDQQSGSIADKNNYILFPIDSELFKEENAGYYTATINLDVVPENQEPISLEYQVSFNLIPEDLYMLVTPQSGVIYKQETEAPYEYTPGYISFNYRIYEGISQNRQYNITVTLNGSQVESSTVTERQENTFRIFSIQSGLNTLTVRASRTTVYTQTYYFYVEESSINLDWFDNPSEWTQYYYRLHETTSNFEQYKGQLYIEQTVNSPTINISGIEAPNLSGNAVINTHIAIGLQYNTINGDNSNIFNFYNANSGSTAVLSINQETTSRSGVDRQLYIKKQDNCDKDNVENYHLIQIYSQYVKNSGNDFYYEISLYIDGVLEQVFPQIYSSPLLITSFDIQPINGFINLLEVDYKEGALNNNCDYEVYKYFLKYQSEILRLDVTKQLTLTEYLPNFNVGLNGRVEVDQSTISNIANNIDTPTLVMTYQNSGVYSDFMATLEQNYGEDGSMPGADMNFPVTLQWSAGNAGLEDITFPSGYTNAQFRAALQGSSTKLYRVKNFTLTLENTDDSEQAEVYLYSPNFANGDTSTFLPETEFTLKADVVDSSHSNNTSCGRFVNTVCRKFSSDITENGYYKDYVRNCLEGFPFLLYLNLVETDPVTQERTSVYYYLGIYNFNLGRSSYYNLGYKDLSVFGEGSNHLLTDAGSGFTFFKISKSEDILRPQLGVAEIQGGSNYFDFSQYDPSILFQQTLSGSYVDNTYMFGDLVRGGSLTDIQLQDSIESLIQKIALAGGYLFDYIKKKRGSYSDGYHAEKMEDGQYTGESLNQVPDYTQQYRRQMGNTGNWEYVLRETIEPGTQLNLQELIIPNLDEGRLAALNFQSLAEYYTICMALGLVDSVQKNLNIKTWNNQTWYLAFYDMDTCLGINNQGSDINYFAFSDYWHSSYTTKGDTDYPTNATIYRDFSPHSMGENGFDVPSSYLFAVAKYSKLIYNSTSDESAAYTSVYPQELYAKWRSNTINNETNEGILKNADYFVDNYFANNLGNINPTLVSYNYRSKYLSLGSNEASVTWVNTDYNKFNGTRINKVREWLNGRLHILDVYFNLNRSVINNIQYLDEDGTWQPVMIGSAPITDVIYSSNYSLSSNPDIVILHDIFSDDQNSAGIQLSGNVDIKIKCPEYSPLQIYNANGAISRNYILGGDNYQEIQFQTTGVQAVKLGGSQAWTYLENINWLSADTLIINSDKLENILGTSGRFSSIQLTTPNLQTLELTSSNYQGTLSLSGTDNFPNLNSINVSRSNLSLNLNDLGVTYVNAANITNAQATINIANCPNLTTFSCANSTLATLNIQGLRGNLKKFTLNNNTNITTINLSCVESGGVLTIIGDNTLEQLTVSGFSQVIVRNCPRLRKVTITQSEIPLTNLEINNCNTNNNVTAINITSTTVETAGTVDLTNCVSGGNSTLTRVYLYGCSKIQKIYLPPNTPLVSQCFRGVSNLETLDGTNLTITGGGVFYGCNKYKMRTSSGSYTDLHVSSSCTSLANLFRKGAYYEDYCITRDDVKHFISTAVPSSNNITDVSYMFFGNNGITYTLDDFKEDLVNSAGNYINLSKFNKVTNATCMFCQCGIIAINKNMWNFGSSNGVNMTAFQEAVNSSVVYVTIDSLQNIISKVTQLFGNYLNVRPSMIFLDNITGETRTDDIPLKDFFNPSGVSPSKLVTLSRFFPSTSQTIDMTDVFTSAWTSLTTLDNFMWAIDTQYKYKNYNKLFYNLPKIKNITNTLIQSSISEERYDLFTLVNWASFSNRGGSVSEVSGDSQSAGTFKMRKYISAADYQTLCNLLLRSSSTNISYIFANCYIIGYTGEFTFGNVNVTNNAITRVCSLYESCQLVSDITGAGQSGMQLSPTFFKNLPKVADVRRMFQNCRFSKPIPFNFFNKRERDTSVDTRVWVQVDGEYQEAEYFTYTYRKEIYCYLNLFYNSTWDQGTRTYDPSLYTIDKDRVVYNNQEYTTYYTRTEIPPEDEEGEVTYQYTEHTVTQPTEITDAENLEGYYVASTQTGYHDETNFALENNNAVSMLIIPPDLFYGTVSSFNNGDSDNGQSLNFNNALYCATPLQGIIPKNIFSKNRTGSVGNTFKNANVIPAKIYSYTSDSQDINVYSCFPSNYTTRSSLDNAFTVQPVVPTNVTQEDKQIINWVFMIQEDSIPSNVTSMDNAFNWDYGGYSVNRGQLNNGNVRINYIGKVSGNNVTTGFDMAHFTSLTVNNLLTSRLTALGYGNLFNSSYDISSATFTGDDDYVLVLADSDELEWLSSQLQFPLSTGTIRRFMTNVGTMHYQLRSNQITNLSTSRSWYEDAGFKVID